MQIIWTLGQLAEWATTSISDFGPEALLTVAPSSRQEFLEFSSVSGKIVRLIVWIPPGPRNLVWVTIFHLHVKARLLLSPRGGDNICYTILTTDNIEPGDHIKVIVRNDDTEWTHTVGVRVEVDEQEQE